jgi:hypothetical protein
MKEELLSIAHLRLMLTSTQDSQRGGEKCKDRSTPTIR